MKICIGGLAASGKSSLGKELAKELSIEHIDPSYKDEVKNRKELLALAKEADIGKARAFDKALVAKAKGKNCVITSWFAPWLIKDATVRVWLNATFEVRASRWAKSNKENMKDARNDILVKDSFPIRLHSKGYGIDIGDKSVFDIELNSERMNKKEMISIISLITLEREKQKFR